jgi:RHS repeat-associated protein
MASVFERYEYDSYGQPYIMSSTYQPRAVSPYGNNFLFTGRETDMLDSGSLKIQYNRHRYLDYYTGRWTTEDPLGYVDGMNLYEYVNSSPLGYKDAFGLNIYYPPIAPFPWDDTPRESSESIQLRKLAVSALREYDTKFGRYDFYTKLTGLQPLVKELIPILQDWILAYSTTTGNAKYKNRKMKLPSDVNIEYLFHEAIHAHNDKSHPFWPWSAKNDEGIAYVAMHKTRM